MKVLTIAHLKAAFAAKGYKWATNGPNLIGVRSSLQVPDTFNDTFLCVFTQPICPLQATNVDKQKFLNRFCYLGKNGLPLKEDGDFGDNSNFAWAAYRATVGTERMLAWKCTTIPGLYYLQNPVPGGCAVMVPGQYVNAYMLGFHQDKPDHPALVQRGGNVTIYRDNDRDNLAEETKVQQSGMFGINIHRSNKEGTTVRIWNWSAGCQVFARMSDHSQLLGVCNYYKQSVRNLFTYTLLRESELA